jgi:invasion protein IalB
VAYNFKIRSKKTKPLTEYESVTQKVILAVDSMLQNVKQLQHERLSWHVRCPSSIQFVSKCSSSNKRICVVRQNIFESKSYRK